MSTIDPSLGRGGHRAFVVEKGTPGFSVGKIEDKMGLRASETAELVLEDCHVPAENLLGGEEAMRRARTPAIYADAAYELLASERTGEALIDDEVLAGQDLSHYQADPSGELALDLFVDGWPE